VSRLTGALAAVEAEAGPPAASGALGLRGAGTALLPAATPAAAQLRGAMRHCRALLRYLGLVNEHVATWGGAGRGFALDAGT
jgi:hypothetical protein